MQLSTFEFDEKYKKYKAIYKHLKIVIQQQFMNDATIYYAKQVCDSYGHKLEAIAAFCMEDEYFTNVYPIETKEQLIAQLGPPLVNIYNERGKLTYIHHQLDDDHIIDIEFDGVFESFTEVVVDG